MARLYPNLVLYLKGALGILELILFLRLVLKFFNANPFAMIVERIYAFSDLFNSPFRLIFRDVSVGGFVIELTTISAMIGYALAALVAYKVLKLLLERE